MTQPEDSTNFQARQILGKRYEILEKIGSGGISTVYKAKDLVLKRVMALKFLNPDKLKDEHLVRLHREAKAICQLQHPNIIDVYDFTILNGDTPVLIMEYVDGRELSQIVEESGPLDLETALTIFCQICKALAYAHNRNILHRDLKPGNVLIDNDLDNNMRVKIFDFGIAKISDLDDDSITRSGFVVGTPPYMSPEQAQNKPVDGRSDIYSLGCLMHMSLTGSPPFLGKNLVETINMQIKKAPPSLTQSKPDGKFPESIEFIVAKTLSKDPNERFKTMEELEAALENVLVSLSEEGTFRQQNDNTGFSMTNLRKALEFFALLTLIVVLIGAPIYLLNEGKKESAKNPEQVIDLQKVRMDNNLIVETTSGYSWHVIKGKVEDSQLEALSIIKPVRLRLRSSSVTELQLSLLKTLPIENLDLRYTKIGDKGIEQISKMTTLKVLLVDDCKNLTEKGLSKLRALENMRLLSLRGTGVSDRTVKELLTMKKLSMLYVSKSPLITDKTIDYVLKMPNLMSLRIGQTKITKAGLEKLQSHPRLVFIGLKNLQLDDNKMPGQFSKNLTMLDVSMNPFTDEGLKKILSLPKLWFLDIRFCDRVSEKGRGAIAAKLPIKENKIYLSDTSSQMAQFGIAIDTEWYFEPSVYDADKWESVKFRKKLMSLERIFYGAPAKNVNGDN